MKHPKLKVLHVYKTSFPSTMGGVEVFIDTLCRDTSKLGIENTVFSLSDTPSDPPIQMNGYKVYQAKQNLHLASTGFSLSAFKLFKQLVAEADLIHYQFPNPFADILHFACHVKKPTVMTYQSDIIKQKSLLKLYTPLMKRFLNSVNQLVTTTPNYLKTSPILQSLKHKTAIIPIGIDKDSYPVPSQKHLEHWKQKLPSKFFLFIGAFRYYKGLQFALEAIANTDIHLVLAGHAYEEENLRQQAKTLNLSNVHFVGSVSNEDKVALLNLCYGFVFPSHIRTEAFGISLLEAAMYAKPLISCEIGTGTTYINQDQVTGLAVKPASSIALREAMQYLLDHPVQANQFGKNAELRYRQLFTSNKTAESYLTLYEALYEESKSVKAD